MMSDRYENLIAEGADLALRIGDLPDSSFVARKLESARRMFLASPSYLVRRGAPMSLADLARHELISGPGDGGDQTWIARRNGRVERQALSPRIHSRSATGVVACVVAGLGIATGSSWMCSDVLASGEAIEILADYAPIRSRPMSSSLPDAGPRNAPVHSAIIWRRLFPRPRRRKAASSKSPRRSRCARSHPLRKA